MMRTLLLAVLICLTGTGWAADAADTGDSQVRLKRTLETVLPPELRHLHIENPIVIYWVSVDATGKLRDFLAVEANHHGLLESAEKKLLEAEFLPANKDGNFLPAQTYVAVPFYDPEQLAWKSGLMSMPMGSNLGEGTESRIYSISKGSFIYEESKPDELDKPLKLLESELYLAQDADRPMAKGSVVVEYYVDHKGRVRHPRVISSDDETLTISVLMTLERTRFAPPQKDGKPTYTRVRQPFNFS